MCPDERHQMHLAGPESAISPLWICEENASQSLLCPSHLPGQISAFSSHKAKYLDTGKALRNWWIPAPPRPLRFHLHCLTPASLKLGPVPSAAGLRGAQLGLCTEPLARRVTKVHRQPWVPKGSRVFGGREIMGAVSPKHQLTVPSL